MEAVKIGGGANVNVGKSKLGVNGGVEVSIPIRRNLRKLSNTIFPYKIVNTNKGNGKRRSKRRGNRRRR